MRISFALAARRTLAAAGFVVVAAFGLSGNASASIVANLGTLSIGANEIVTCKTVGLGGCTTTVGSASGALPAGAFTQQIQFDIGLLSSAVAINSTLTVSPISITSIGLYQWNGVGTLAAGDANVNGTLVAPGAPTGIPGGIVWSLSAVLDPAGLSYFIEIVGSTSGSQAQYTQQIAVSAVPLPPALILFATALFGMIGVGRIRRRRAAVAA